LAAAAAAAAAGGAGGTLAPALAETAAAARNGDVAMVLAEDAFVVQPTPLSCWAATLSMVMNFQYVKQGDAPNTHAARNMAVLDELARRAGLSSTPSLRGTVYLDVGNRFGDLKVLQRAMVDVLKLKIEKDVSRKDMAWWRATLRASGPVAIAWWVPDFGHMIVVVGTRGDRLLALDPDGTYDKPLEFTVRDVAAMHSTLNSKLTGELKTFFRAAYWSPQSPTPLPTHASISATQNSGGTEVAGGGTAVVLFKKSAFDKVRQHQCACEAHLASSPTHKDSVDPTGLKQAASPKDRFFLDQLTRVPQDVNIECECGAARTHASGKVTVPESARLTFTDRSKWTAVSGTFSAVLGECEFEAAWAPHSERIWPRPANA
jgi:hypothetical protein